jgi:hypothetical protein
MYGMNNIKKGSNLTLFGKQNRQRSINVTVRRVRVTIVAMEKLQILSVCLSLSYPA